MPRHESKLLGWALRSLGRLFSVTGERLARVVLLGAQFVATERRNMQSEGVAVAELSEHALRLGHTTDAARWADRAWKLAENQRVERDFIRAALMQGCVALRTRKLTRADERLHHVLTRARAVDMVDMELPALIALAELALVRGKSVDARARLEDVWEAAERGPYPIYQADAYNVFTDIAIAEGGKSAAINAATKAYNAAWCDGPPHAYYWGLEKARAHLRALGAPEPKLLPFDESKFAPLLEVEINPKDKYWVDPDKLDD